MKKVWGVIKPFKLFRSDTDPDDAGVVENLLALPYIDEVDVVDATAQIASPTIREQAGPMMNIPRFNFGDKPEALPRYEVSVVVPDRYVNDVMEILQRAAHTGKPADGRIFVEPIDIGFDIAEERPQHVRKYLAELNAKHTAG